MQWTNKHKIFFAITVVIVILALSLFNWKRRKIWSGGIGLLFWYLFLPLLSPSSSERQKKCHLGIDKRPKKVYLYAVFWDRHIAGWSSPVARQAHNLKVGGSNPPPATKYLQGFEKNLKAFSFCRCRTGAAFWGTKFNQTTTDLKFSSLINSNPNNQFLNLK